MWIFLRPHKTVQKVKDFYLKLVPFYFSLQVKVIKGYISNSASYTSGLYSVNVSQDGACVTQKLKQLPGFRHLLSL